MSAAQIERKRTEHSVVGYLTGAMSFAVASAPALADTKKDAASADTTKTLSVPEPGKWWFEEGSEAPRIGGL